MNLHVPESVDHVTNIAIRKDFLKSPNNRPTSGQMHAQP